MNEIASLMTATSHFSWPGEFFDSLPRKALKEFESIASVASCPSDTELFAEHGKPSHIFISCDGQVKLFTRSSDSRRLILSIAEPGELLGLSAAITGRSYQMTAETLYSCTIASIQRSDFLDLLNRYPAAYQAVARELSLQQEQACARLRTIGLTHCTAAKIGQLLLEWCATGRQTDHGASIHFALTHGEIAECIGTSRETVTRVLSDFRRRRIVDVRGAILTIMDRSALESCSDV